MILQALEIPFTCCGVSEPNLVYQDFEKANHAACVEHMHNTMSDQTVGAGCLLHPKSEECNLGQGHSLAVFGTPCPPFSTMRTKRFQEGSVKSHQLHDVTFKESVQWLQSFRPAAAILEQVAGFDKPEVAGGHHTPLHRSPGSVASGVRYLATCSDL